MAFRKEPQLAATIRGEGSTDPLPPGWAAMPLRWHGRDMEVAFDPRRHKVMRVAAGQMDRDDRRRKATGAGWNHVFTDAEGAELWIADQADLARGRLGRLLHPRTVGADLAGPGLA